MKTHLLFLRHFEKRSHLLQLPPRLMRALPAPVARAVVRFWSIIDRHAVGLSPGGRRLGRERALILARALYERGIAPTRVIASPYRRTRESAAVIAEILKLPVRLDERLAELDLGARSACDFEAFSRAFPAYRERVEREGYLRVAAPYACESHADAREGRVRAFLTELERTGENAVVVAHYNILDCVAQLAYGWSDESTVERMAALAGAGYGEGFFVTLDEGAISATGEFSAREPH